MGLVRVIVFAESVDRKEEVVLPDDVPASQLVAMLVERLQLPASDPDGIPLGYSLCHRASGKVLPQDSTLLQAGVREDAELLLTMDSLSIDDDDASLSWETTIQPKPADPESDSSVSEVIEFDQTITSLPTSAGRESSADGPEQPGSDSWSGSSDSSVGLPSKLGRYKIVDQIGQGGMGVVFRGYDEQLDRNVAIKVLPGAMYSRPESLSGN